MHDRSVALVCARVCLWAARVHPNVPLAYVRASKHECVARASSHRLCGLASAQGVHAIFRACALHRLGKSIVV
eukprot:6188333-Pleurochrysis_carterae.AAC.5